MTLRILILVVAAMATHAAHLGLDATELPQPPTLRETLPSEEALQLLSLSYGSAAADYYWLRAINHFGTQEMHEVDYPNLEPFVRRVLSLDPYFVAGYYLAGTSLTLPGQDFHSSTELLKRGMKYRPDSWKIPFFLGFNAFHFERDFETAAWAMTIAARLPGSPNTTPLLAARLAAETDEPELGLSLVDAMLEEVEDEQIREVYLERRKSLLLEVELKNLNLAAAMYRQRLGRAPASLDDLVQPGLLRGYPKQDPFGGRYSIGADGRVHSSNDDKRLRIDPRAIYKGQR